MYETSFYLAVAFKSRQQSTASRTHLQELFDTLLSMDPRPQIALLSQRESAFILASMVSDLTERYPSQATSIFDGEDSIRRSRVTRLPEDVGDWIRSLRSSLNRRDFLQCNVLTNQSGMKALLASLFPNGVEPLIEKALLSTLAVLRSKVQKSAWQVLRVAYRDITITSELDAATWLSRFLLLEIRDDPVPTVGDWFQQKAKDGHVVKKEGSTGRWIMCKGTNT